MTFTLEQFSLKGKVALVTGAGGRGNSIGRAYALGLAGVGARVVVADLNLAGAEAVASEIRAMGQEAIAAQVDISNPESVAAMAQQARAAYGGVDVLVNNAAMMAELDFAPAFMCKLADWNKILSVNLTGALLVSQAIIPMMQERGGGKIVNQVSAGAFPAFSVYGITKLALTGLTTTLARELGPSNINVNAIAPGITMTDAGKIVAPPDSPLKQMLKNVIALRMEGVPDELVGALLLLTTPAGAWITGQVLHVDGGWVIQ